MYDDAQTRAELADSCDVPEERVRRASAALVMWLACRGWLELESEFAVSAAAFQAGEATAEQAYAALGYRLARGAFRPVHRAEAESLFGSFIGDGPAWDCVEAEAGLPLRRVGERFEELSGLFARLDQVQEALERGEPVPRQWPSPPAPSSSSPVERGGLIQPVLISMGLAGVPIRPADLDGLLHRVGLGLAQALDRQRRGESGVQWIVQGAQGPEIWERQPGIPPARTVETRYLSLGVEVRVANTPLVVRWDGEALEIREPSLSAADLAECLLQIRLGLRGSQKA